MPNPTNPDATPPPSSVSEALGAPPPDTSMLSALRYGTHNALAGFGNTLKVAGAPEWGDAVANAIAAPVNYQPASDAALASLTKGDWDALAGMLPRAVLEQAPDLLGALGTGAAGSALAGPVGGLVGTAAYYGGRDYGDTAQAHAAAQGHATPTTDDLESAASDTALMSGLKSVGLRGAGAAAGAVARGAAGVAKSGWDIGANLVGELSPILDAPATKEAGIAYEMAQAAQDQKDSKPGELIPIAKSWRWAKNYAERVAAGLPG